jgi:phosphate starvation-inducible PhoH-like protein
MAIRKIELDDLDQAARLLGQYDENLKRLERNYNVQIMARSNILIIRGKSKNVDRAIESINKLIREDKGHYRKGEEEFMPQQASAIDARHSFYHVDSSASIEKLPSPEKSFATIYVTYNGREIAPRTHNQYLYIEAIKRNDLVVGIGPAGTGKTFLAVASALAELEDGVISRIILTRPVVEAGEKLGFLPGDFYEKIDPYVKPLYDAFYLMLGPKQFHEYREEGIIDVVPIAYMRGRTLDSAFVIVDEAQNSTYDQMKMVLTRLGLDSKMVITGDITQIDIEDKEKSGLICLQEIIKGIPGVEFIYFDEHDVVRHELVKKIIKAYEAWESKRQQLQKGRR